MLKQRKPLNPESKKHKAKRLAARKRERTFPQPATVKPLTQGTYAGAVLAPAPKNAPWRSDALRGMAKGEPCNLLAVDRCLSLDGSTTVACHRNEGKGMAQKQSDEWMVHGCMHCHEWLDRSGAPRAEKRRAFDAAHALRQVPFWRLAAVDPQRTPGERAAATEALRRLNATPVHPLWFDLPEDQ